MVLEEAVEKCRNCKANIGFETAPYDHFQKHTCTNCSTDNYFKITFKDNPYTIKTTPISRRQFEKYL